MTIEEKKEELYEYIAQLEEEIEILKGNIAEFKQILEKIQTEDDIEKYKDFDIEKGLNISIKTIYNSLHNKHNNKNGYVFAEGVV